VPASADAVSGEGSRCRVWGPAFPVKAIWAVTKDEARRDSEHASARAALRPRRFGLLACAFCLFIAIQVLQGEFHMRMRIIYSSAEVAADVEFSAGNPQYASSCVALHLQTRQNNPTADSSSCVITRDHHVPASADAVSGDGSRCLTGAGTGI
jgi:hypothetical protein